MRLTRQEAARLAARSWPHGLNGEVTKTSYGWLFGLRPGPTATSVEEVRFGPPCSDMAVERDTGRVLPVYDSPFGPGRDRVVASYEKGYRFDFYDLTIKAASDRRQTAHVLLELGVHYVIPEYVIPKEEGGDMYTIPQAFDVDEILALLDDVPVTFTSQYLSPASVLDATEAFDQTDCCEYQVRGFIPDEPKPRQGTGPIPPTRHG